MCVCVRVCSRVYRGVVGVCTVPSLLLFNLVPSPFVLRNAWLSECRKLPSSSVPLPHEYHTHTHHAHTPHACAHTQYPKLIVKILRDVKWDHPFPVFSQPPALRFVPKHTVNNTRGVKTKTIQLHQEHWQNINSWTK